MTAAAVSVRSWMAPQARKANDNVRCAVRSGRLHREPCYCCGVEPRRFKDLHAHHDDWAQELDIVWLCSRCHVKVTHRKIAPPPPIVCTPVPSCAWVSSECRHDVLATLERDELRAKFALFCGRLRGREWDALRLRSQGLTLQAIGHCLGLTRERVRQIEASAMRRLEGLEAGSP